MIETFRVGHGIRTGEDWCRAQRKAQLAESAEQNVGRHMNAHLGGDISNSDVKENVRLVERNLSCDCNISKNQAIKQSVLSKKARKATYPASLRAR